MKIEMGNVRTIKIIEPTVASTSIKPPRSPSAENLL